MLYSRTLLLMMAAVLLAACGFHPVYQKAAPAGVKTTMLSSIAIEPMDGLAGQQLHSALEDLFNPTALSVPPSYRLSIGLTENEFPVAIAKNGQITRYNMVFIASFTLKDSHSSAVIDKGVIKTIGSYDAVDSRYSTFIARDYTRNSTIKVLSEDVKMRIIAALYR
jgi:LPS-assembly lipoprotein